MLKDVFTKPFDLMKINPYVRFVMMYNIAADTTCRGGCCTITG